MPDILPVRMQDKLHSRQSELRAQVTAAFDIYH